MYILDFLVIGFNLLPSILFFIGLAALALGWIPKLGKLMYVYLAYSFLLNYFEGMLESPEWLTKTTPQSWLAKMPMEDFDVKKIIIVTMISILLMTIGYYGYNKRDMVEGA